MPFPNWLSNAVLLTRNSLSRLRLQPFGHLPVRHRAVADAGNAQFRQALPWRYMRQRNDVDRQITKLTDHIKSKGYHIIDHEPTDEDRKSYPLLAKVVKRKGGYNAQRTPMDLPIAQKAVTAVQSTIDYSVIQVPSLGGSLPLFLFEQYLQAKPVTVPVVNYDNNQHAENENVVLQYLWEGIETMAAIMMMK